MKEHTVNERPYNGKYEERQPADDERTHDYPQSGGGFVVLETNHGSEFLCKTQKKESRH
jgi:saccharopine dehydrogenase-like NADP-dependent oxidoreductase